MKAVDILKEEAIKAGKEVEHQVLEDVLALVKVALPRLAVEADEAIVKSIAGVALVVLPAIEPAIEKAIAAV